MADRLLRCTHDAARAGGGPGRVPHRRGLVAAVVHRSIRNRRGDLDTAASVTIMAIAFAAVSIVALELILTRLERLLL
jgi:hypothetical protein